jgi:hypothetical protein
MRFLFRTCYYLAQCVKPRVGYGGGPLGLLARFEPKHRERKFFYRKRLISRAGHREVAALLHRFSQTLSLALY